jgi:hypothetical protein
MIFGESFEEQAPSVQTPKSASALPLGDTWIQSTVNPDLFIRHCDYVLWQSETISPFEDFLWNVVPALNCQPNSVSFQSTNYPTYFLTLSNATGILIASFVCTCPIQPGSHCRCGSWPPWHCPASRHQHLQRRVQLPGVSFVSLSRVSLIRT